MSFKPMSATNARQSGIAPAVLASLEGPDMQFLIREELDIVTILIWILIFILGYLTGTSRSN